MIVPLHMAFSIRSVSAHVQYNLMTEEQTERNTNCMTTICLRLYPGIII